MGFYGSQNSKTNVSPLNLLDTAIRYLREGWNAPAFLLLSEAKPEKEPAAEFALALCYLRAGELSAAVLHLEQALRLIRTASVPPSQETNETYIKLYKEQLEEQIYLTPMDADFFSLFPKEAEQTVLLALIHVYQQKGMDEQAQRLSAGLVGTVFEEHKKRLFDADLKSEQ